MAGRRWALFAALTALALFGSLGRSAVLAQGCGNETFKAGVPEIDQREQWRQADEGLGAFLATLVTEEVVVATAITPGCALGIDSLRAYDLASSEELWALTLDDLPPGAGGSEPTGAGDLVFVTGLAFGTGDGGEDERTLTAIEAATGETRWTWTTPGQPLLEVIGENDGQIVVLAGDETSTLLALDAVSGEERWSVPFEGYGSVGTIDAAAGNVYVDGFAPGGVEEGLFLTAFDLASGDLRWRLDEDDAFELRIVALGNGRAFVVETGEDEAAIRAIDAASGDETWTLTLPENAPGGSWSVVGDADLLVAVEAGDDGRGSVVAVDPATGEERWNASLDVAVGVAASTLGENELVFRLPDMTGGFDQGLLALDRETGAERWRLDLPALGDVLVAGDVAYVSHGEPGEGQALRALEAATGDELWNLGFPEFANVNLLDLAGDSLLLSGSNDEGAALIAVSVS